MTFSLTALLSLWSTNEGRPSKANLIDWHTYESNPTNLSCMSAQGQVLHLLGGWLPERLKDADQLEAEAETAKLLGISLTHVALLRSASDIIKDAPWAVLNNPTKVLGSQWSKLLDFWWMLDQFDKRSWQQVNDAWIETSPEDADRAWRDADSAAWDAAGKASLNEEHRHDVQGASWEIQGFEILKQREKKVLFLPWFGIRTLDDIPPRPENYGLGVLPTEVAQLDYPEMTH